MATDPRWRWKLTPATSTCFRCSTAFRTMLRTINATVPTNRDMHPVIDRKGTHKTSTVKK